MTRQKIIFIGVVFLMGLLAACAPAETPALEPEAGRPAEQGEATVTPPPLPTVEEQMGTKQPLSDDDREDRIEIRTTVSSEGSSEPLEEPVIVGDEGEEELAADEQPVGIVGEVPAEIISNIMADIAAANDNADQGQMTVRRAEAVVFSDGSLGCPQPGEFYTMALVNGYIVEVEVNGEVYDYRVNDNGYFRLCEGGRPFVPPAGTPSS